MRLIIALKVFWKAFWEPEKGKQFLASQPKPKIAETSDQSHLRLLSALQQAGRLIDFLKEDIGGFTDAQVGAAVRKVHEDCAHNLEELITIRPLKEEQEGATIVVPKGCDPAEIKIVGKVKGEPPFTGILVHRGWKAHKRSLPKKTGEESLEILCPAEIEIKP